MCIANLRWVITNETIRVAAAECPADADYQEVNGTCYLPVANNMTLREAETYCDQYDAVVAMVPDTYTQDVLGNLMQDEGWENMWIGAKEMTTPWRWVSGTEYGINL